MQRALHLHPRSSLPDLPLVTARPTKGQRLNIGSHGFHQPKPRDGRGNEPKLVGPGRRKAELRGPKSP